MMTLDTQPTRQQLEDKSFWEGLPPNGVLYDGYEYAPLYSVFRDGQRIEFSNEKGDQVFSSFHYDIAVAEAERLSNIYNGITVQMTGFSQSLVRKDEY